MKGLEVTKVEKTYCEIKLSKFILTFVLYVIKLT